MNNEPAIGARVAKFACKLLAKLPHAGTLVAAIFLTFCSGAAFAGQLPASVFQPYNAANASSIQAGPFALFTVPVSSLRPTQLNEGPAEVGKKAAGFDLLTPAELPGDLITDIEPVIIGPGGTLYLTDGHHTFTALLDSIYGASNPTVFVNVIANYSNMTTSQFFAALQAQNFLLPLNDGVPQTVNLSTGSPIPTSLTTLTTDAYRGLEYSILKNKSSVLFPTTANITGAVGAGVPGLDKMTGSYTDFLEAAAYRNANNGLGLPTISPGDIALATQWNLTPTSQTTLPNVSGTVTAAQLPGFILNSNITLNGPISNATLANGALDGKGTFTGITSINAGSTASPIFVGTQNTGFIMELGNDNGFTVTLNGTNSYTGGTTIAAGTLIVASDASLGAAVPTGATVNPNNILPSVQAANGIIFNSLTEGNGTLQIGTTPGNGTATFTTSRPIAVDGETATINVNGYIVSLTGPLISLGTNGNGLGNATGVSDLTIDDNSSSNGVLILSTASPNFYGNIVVGNANSPTVRVMSDAALGNTTGPAVSIGSVELNGGTFQVGANITAPERNFFLGGGSQFDVNGTTSTWGTMTDVQRTLEILNSSTTSAGAVTFNNLNIATSTILQLAGGSEGETVTLTNGIVRTGNATVIIQPTSATSLGTATEKLFSGTGSASLVNSADPIAPVWIVTNNGVAKGAGPYDFVTYGANGYVKATYNGTTLTNTSGQVVALAANASPTGNVQAFALNTEGKTITIGSGNTLTLGDGTNAAGLILAKNSAISGGTLAFGGSEGVVWLGGTGATISSAITGTNGLTFTGSGAVSIGSAANVSGLIAIDSGSVTLSGANVFANDTSGVFMGNTKSKPAAAGLAISANNALTQLNSVGSNSTIALSNGAALTLGDTTNNLSSTVNSPLTQTGTAVAGALTFNGSGLFDFSGAGKNALGLLAGSSIIVNNSAQFRVVANEFKSNFAVVLNGTSQLQFAQNAGGVFANPVSGSGALHLIGGTLQITGTNNTYTGGTIVEVGSILDITTANLPAANPNITNAGGLVVFDQATSGTYNGVISDGLEMGTGPSLSGSLDKDDSTGANGGNVALAKAQTFTGATTIEAGTLTLNAVNSLATSSGVDLGRVGGGATATLALGANNQIQALSSEANNTTAVTLGSNTLTINTAATTNATFQGVISGTGGLVISGAGIENFTGANIFTGPTNITGGMLMLTGGSLAGSANVAVGGTLAGVGSVGATNVAGTIGAGTTGTPFGTLSVKGGLTFAPTATLVVTTNGTSSSVLSATGAASLSGSVQVANTGAANAYSLIGRSSAILTAGSVSGTFGGATLFSAAGANTVVPTLSYHGTEVDLSYVANTLNALLPGGLTGNQVAVVQAINTVLATGNAPAAFVNLFNQSPAALQDFVSRAAGEGYTNANTAITRAELAFSGLLNSQMESGSGAFAETDTSFRMMVASVDPTFVPAPGADKLWGVWSSGFGEWQSIGANSGGHGSSSTVGGGAVGADYRFAPDARVGLSVGYGSASTATSGLGDSSTQDFGQIALYGVGHFGQLYIDGLFGGGLTSGTETRDVSVPGMPSTAKGDLRGSMLFGGGEVGQHFAWTDGFVLTPFAGLTFAHVNQNPVNETGSIFGLAIAGQTTDSVRGSIGGRIGWNVPLGDVILNTEAMAGWGHEFADVRTPSTASFLGTPSSSFIINGAASARDIAELGLAVNAHLNVSTNLFLRYDGELGSNDTVTMVRGGVRLVW